jgi:hypothetical protein
MATTRLYPIRSSISTSRDHRLRQRLPANAIQTDDARKAQVRRRSQTAPRILPPNHSNLHNVAHAYHCRRNQSRDAVSYALIRRPQLLRPKLHITSHDQPTTQILLLASPTLYPKHRPQQAPADLQVVKRLRQVARGLRRRARNVHGARGPAEDHPPRHVNESDDRGLNQRDAQGQADIVCREIDQRMRFVQEIFRWKYNHKYNPIRDAEQDWEKEVGYEDPSSVSFVRQVAQLVKENSKSSLVVDEGLSEYLLT